MKPILLAAAFFLGMTMMTTNAESLVERLIASYDAVATVSCEVRKETAVENGPKGRMLSRVHYEKPDKLHVETYSPLRRRIVADGKELFSHIEGDPKGYRKAVDALDKEWRISLRKVPATAMDHLMRMSGAEETDLPAAEGFARRVGCRVDGKYVVLNLDDQNRLARIEFFESETMSVKTGTFDYRDFTEPVPGAWFPTLYEGVIEFGGVTTRETTRVTNLRVNEAIAPALFEPGHYFKDVEFVGDFKEIYGN